MRIEGSMDFMKLISKRYSVRAYKSTPIEDLKLSKVLQAACLAPTAANRQPFQIIVVHTQGKESELLSIYEEKWFVQAPIILCVCGLPTLSWIRKDSKSYLDIDIAIVMDHMILAATNLGLGTCFIAAFNPQNARKVLSLPIDVEPLLFSPLGYPDSIAGIKKRKKLEELVRYEHW
jgi:nitroreductase